LATFVSITAKSMDAVSKFSAAAVMHDLNCVLATLDPYCTSSNGRRLASAYLSIQSAKDLLFDQREQRAVQLLRHARKVLGPYVNGGLESGAEGLIEKERGLIVARHLDNAMRSLGMPPN
jgi:hypothetical protein